MEPTKTKRSMRKRRQYTPQFKAGAVRLVLDEGKSVTDVARDLDLTRSALDGWVRQAKIDAGRGAPGALTTAEKEELSRLRRENRELRMERGMTLDELAQLADISASHLSRLERGQTAPSFRVAAEIARHIGVKPSELATIQREQSDVDQHLTDLLIERGLDIDMAQHICDRISTQARAALLEALRPSNQAA